MLCEDVMQTDVEWLSPGDTVQAAAHRMREYGVVFLPVCQEGQVLGTLSARDIVARVVSEDRPVTTPVIDVMSCEVASCRPNDDLEYVRRAMVEQRRDRMLCLDDHGQLVGMVTLDDISLRAEQRQRRADSYYAH